jgi:hypothetical protein
MQSSSVEGYSTSTVPPPAQGGGLPDTGADIGPIMGLGAALLFVGAAVLAAVNGWRTAHARPAEAPAYLASPVVPSTWDQE